MLTLTNYNLCRLSIVCSIVCTRTCSQNLLCAESKFWNAVVQPQWALYYPSYNLRAQNQSDLTQNEVLEIAWNAQKWSKTRTLHMNIVAQIFKILKSQVAPETHPAHQRSAWVLRLMWLLWMCGLLGYSWYEKGRHMAVVLVLCLGTLQLQHSM